MTYEEAIKTLNEVIPPPNHVTVDLDHINICQAWIVIKEHLQQLQIKEVRHGKWIDTTAYCGEFTCSICKEMCVTNKYHYCPNCGAEMDKEKEE